MTGSRRPVTYRCVGCGKVHADGLEAFCGCGHFVDACYDLTRARLRASDDPCLRYLDLLPLEDGTQLVGPSHGMTPCHRAKALGESLGLANLYLKDETGLPTGTTKDRMGRMVVSCFQAAGVRGFTASSTGNSSTAVTPRLWR